MTESKNCKYAMHKSITHSELNFVSVHAGIFATPDGSLTTKSITNEHTCQGITKNVDLKARTILNILNDAKLKPTADNIAGCSNPASLGIWDSNGNFIEEQFNRLQLKSVMDEGKLIITRDMIEEFRYELHGKKDYGPATKIFYVVPVSWKRITDGSFDELFLYYNDHWWFNKATGEYEPALTVDHLRKFYMDPAGFMEMRIRKIVPVAKPFIN
jgi:hypothetical protein